MQKLTLANARSVLFTGLMPYSYNSSQGVQVAASVQAINDEGERSVAVTINGGTLPRKFPLPSLFLSSSPPPLHYLSSIKNKTT